MIPSGASGSAELYVYYSVEPSRLAAAAMALTELGRRCAQHGLTMRALKRRDSKADGTQTWMEIYPTAPGDLEQVLERLVMACGINDLTGPRVLEWFVAVP